MLLFYLQMCIIQKLQKLNRHKQPMRMKITCPAMTNYKNENLYEDNISSM